MTDLPAARTLLTDTPTTTYGVVVLGYDARLLRRKRLVTTEGEGFLVDLPAVTNLDDFWGFQLDDGRCIQVLPAEEPLLQITGDLSRLAWHIGNRHTPCQIEPDRLLIRQDHVLEAMLRQLGAQVALVTEPFTPEGGAYGTGRTMGHSHGPEAEPESFGWHDHGDGKVHFHAPKR
ncbi:MAG: urease accessory protein UreE [Pseudorhodobacter sp.]|nr:urease accessory protein UreE [Pseudorhodobacter sp.]